MSLVNQMDAVGLIEVIKPHENEIRHGQYCLSSKELIPLRCNLLSVFLEEQLKIDALPIEFSDLCQEIIKQLNDSKKQSGILCFFMQAIFMLPKRG